MYPADLLVSQDCQEWWVPTACVLGRECEHCVSSMAWWWKRKGLKEPENIGPGWEDDQDEMGWYHDPVPWSLDHHLGCSGSSQQRQNIWAAADWDPETWDGAIWDCDDEGKPKPVRQPLPP